MEPFVTIRRAPALFFSGAGVIILAVILLGILLFGRSPALWIAAQAGVQGVGWVMLLRLCRKKRLTENG